MNTIFTTPGKNKINTRLFILRRFGNYFFLIIRKIEDFLYMKLYWHLLNTIMSLFRDKLIKTVL